jgi:UDP-glucose 4-epimerase
MKVLITGGAGYIGSHVSASIALSGYKVTILDDFSHSSSKTIGRIEKIVDSSIECIQCDILDKIKMLRVFQKVKPDIIIHLAGLKSVSESIIRPLKYYETNFGGTLNVLEAMDRIECNQIIFSSTATVYGASDKKCNEDCNLFPMQPYGRSKLMSEQLINDWSQTSSTKKAVVFRYFNPLGAHHSGIIGENPTREPANIMPLIIKAVLQNQEFKIFGNDYDTIDGTGVRDYIHVMDVADAHISALKANLSAFNVFNLGIGRGTSVLELVNMFEKITGKKVNRNIVHRRPGDIGYSCADATKAAEILNWFPRYNVAHMCEDTWRYIKTATGTSL